MQSANKLTYIESNSFDPYLNLSVEKALFENIKEGEIILYLWQNEKTVVCGRNQNVFNECNLEKAKRLGIKISRRESGGGAVFHDLGNLNFTFIACESLYDVDINLKVIEMAVSKFGLNACHTGRNDITIDEKKFSGNAFHKVGKKCCHHGTIMVNVNTTSLSDILNVDIKKLESKGVDSVKSRVINLHELNNDITVENMKETLKESFLKVFNKKDFSEIIDFNEYKKTVLNIKEVFESEEWIYGTNPKFTTSFEKRFDWGNVEFNFESDKGIIKNVKVYSDSLFPNFILNIENNLLGARYDLDAIYKAIDKASIGTDEDTTKYADDIKFLIKSSI